MPIFLYVKQKEDCSEQRAKQRKNVQNFDLKWLLLNKNRDHLNTNSARWTGSRKRRQRSSSHVSRRHLEMKKLWVMILLPAIHQNALNGHDLPINFFIRVYLSYSRILYIYFSTAQIPRGQESWVFFPLYLGLLCQGFLSVPVLSHMLLFLEPFSRVYFWHPVLSNHFSCFHLFRELELTVFMCLWS